MLVSSLQRLAQDFSKANECLRIWGRGEGDDLSVCCLPIFLVYMVPIRLDQDTLSSSATLLHHLASAFSQFATHEETVRTQMKAVRKAEEDLDELKKRRKNVGAQADTADKKLSKMNSEVRSQAFILSNWLSRFVPKPRISFFYSTRTISSKSKRSTSCERKSRIWIGRF